MKEDAGREGSGREDSLHNRSVGGNVGKVRADKERTTH